MKIWFISDTHQLHSRLKVPKDIDVVIHAGDATNNGSSLVNHSEMIDFLNWYQLLNIPTKIFVPGNHDTSVQRGLIGLQEFQLRNIIYLEDSYVMLNQDEITGDGIMIYGSPWTPNFGVGWAWNKDRFKLESIWNNVPSNTDILVTHGPPKGILDLSRDRDGKLEYCGDKALLNKVLKVKPKIHCFGHIHNSEDNINQGVREYEGIKFINASCVEDGRFDKGPSSYGVVIDY